MRDKLLYYKKSIFNFFKYNKQFGSYVVLSLVCVSLIRYQTIGLTSDWTPLLIDFGVILVVGSLCFLFRPQKQFRYLIVWICLYTAMSFSNAIYYSFFNSFASIGLLTAITQVKDVSDAVIHGLHLNQFIYLLVPIIFIYINRRLTNRDYFNFVAKFERSKSLLLKIFVVGTSVLFLTSLTLSATAFSRLSRQWNREYIVSKFGIVTYHLNDLFNTLRPTIVSWFGYDVAVRSFYDYFDEFPNNPSNNEYTGIYADKNVILLHLESISQFLIDLEINGVEITPNLNKLYKEGLSFSNFYPQIGVGTSSDSEFTTLTALMPPTVGTAYVNYFDRTYISMPSLLREKNYYTFSTHANKGSMWNRSRMHANLGFVDFYDQPHFEIDEEIGLGLSDKSFFRQLIPLMEKVEENNDNYMGMVITLTNHTPFELNDLFTELDLTHYNEETGERYPFLEGTRLGNYLISSHYADQALGLFIDLIKESEYFKDTVFVMYGDHDPRLSVKVFHDFYNFDKSTGLILTEEDEDYVVYDSFSHSLNRNTPLIIWGKDKRARLGTNIDYFMGSIDIMPTLGNMFDFFNPFAIGKDIFETRNDNILPFPNGNFITSRIFYNASREEYRAISLDETLSEEYIIGTKERVEMILELAGGIIVHDLIRKELAGELIR